MRAMRPRRVSGPAQGLQLGLQRLDLGAQCLEILRPGLGFRPQLAQEALQLGGALLPAQETPLERFDATPMACSAMPFPPPAAAAVRGVGALVGVPATFVPLRIAAAPTVLVAAVSRPTATAAVAPCLAAAVAPTTVMAVLAALPAAVGVSATAGPVSAHSLRSFRRLAMIGSWRWARRRAGAAAAAPCQRLTLQAPHSIIIAVEYSTDAMEKVQALAALHRALAHPVRLRLLDILVRREACVCHLTAVLGLRQPYVSQQLAALRDAGLVVARRDGTLVYYRLKDARLAGLLALGQSLVRAAAPGTSSRPPVRDGPVSGCVCPACVAAESGDTAATDPPAASDAPSAAVLVTRSTGSN